MDGVPPRIPVEVEAAIKSALANPSRGEATLVLASIANRATAALHQVARAEAAARKGRPEWGQWAALANVSRDAVLRTAAGRQSATQLAQAERVATVVGSVGQSEASVNTTQVAKAETEGDLSAKVEILASGGDTGDAMRDVSDPGREKVDGIIVSRNDVG